MNELLLNKNLMLLAQSVGGDILAGCILSYLDQWPAGFHSRCVVDNLAKFWNVPNQTVEKQMAILVARRIVWQFKEADGVFSYEFNRSGEAAA